MEGANVQVAVVGGGISGLATAFGLVTQGIDVRIFEPTEIGGKISTAKVAGYLCEHGPHAVINNAPETTALFDALGLTALPASAEAKTRYIYARGRLWAIPGSFEELRKSKLLGPLGKIRLALEPLIWPSRLPEETVEGFFRRRCGRQVARRLAAPLCAGIYAGDPRTLSVQAAFPKMMKLMAAQGSLVRALRSMGDKAALGAGLVTLPDGMGSLVHKLEERLAGKIDRHEVRGVTRTPAGLFQLELVDTLASAPVGKPHTIDVPAVVLATPVAKSQAMLGDLGAGLGGVPTVSVDVCSLGFHERDVPVPTTGYGFLVAANEDMPILGCLYESSLFPGRAPAGHVLLRVMLGGSIRPEIARMSGEDVVAAAREGLRRSLGIEATPHMTHLHRYKEAIPQYTLGHLERVAAADHLEMAWPGLFLLGNGLRGVGVNDCIREAARTSTRIARYMGAATS